MLEAKDGEERGHAVVGQMIEQALEQHSACTVGRRDAGTVCEIRRIGGVGGK